MQAKLENHCSKTACDDLPLTFPPRTLEMVNNVSLVHPPDMSPCPHSPLWSKLRSGEGGSLTGRLPGFFLLLVTTSSHTIQENHFRRTLCPLRFTMEGEKPKKRTMRRREWTDPALDGVSTERREQGVKHEDGGSVIYRKKYVCSFRWPKFISHMYACGLPPGVLALLPKGWEFPKCWEW